MSQFEGKSENFNFQEALNQAVESALMNLVGSDVLVSFTVSKISGRRGGLSGFTELSVVIDAHE